ncbi:MAG: ABC transporter C-terminal domain-containing protein, partial [Vicinamibacterales bacterium]|nr:ABC transporter C-terminal domain-containing protein [Vicinamibacterales bacterium]
ERRLKREQNARQKRVVDLEQRISDREREIRTLEETMSSPGFYDRREAAQPVVDRHQTLMWEVGDLMGQWEALQQTDGADTSE